MRCLSLLALCLAVPSAVADDPSGLAVKLIARRTVVEIPLAHAAAGFVDRQRATARRGKDPADSAPVELVLELHNRSADEVVVRLGGDASHLALTAEGAGAATVEVNVAVPSIYVPGRAVRIAAGHKHAIPIRRLRHGRRGGERTTYFTKPGEAKLTATLHVRIEDRKATLQSQPIGLRVKLKEPKRE